MVSYIFVTERLLNKIIIMRRDVFQAIADPTRREIIDMVARQSLNLNSVAERFDVSRPLYQSTSRYSWSAVSSRSDSRAVNASARLASTNSAKCRTGWLNTKNSGNQNWTPSKTT